MSSGILGLMSGHSKWSTIKRAKAVNDNARGKVFSKLVRGITMAVKTGGPDPVSNYRLRVAIEAARAENMPKETIERAISRSEEGSALEEIVYEGFGPNGVGLLVDISTQMLSLIDLGVEDMEEAGEGIEAYTNSHELFSVKEKVEKAGFKVLAAELIQKPKSQVPVDKKVEDKLLELISSLESHDDVQKVFDNAAIS